MNKKNLNIIVFFLLFVVSCKVLPTKPYLAKPAKIDFSENSNLSKEEKVALRNRLFLQQDDSVKVTIKENFFFIRTLVKPIVYDSVYANISSKNMEASLNHLGYYKAKVLDSVISISKKKVYIKYTVNPGIATRIESYNYRLKNSDLQKIATQPLKDSLLKPNAAVTKTAILGEIARLVDSFRNNGYYKFTASELRMRGDSSIAALTDISDDPIEQLEALLEAQKKKDSPTIKLALVLVKPDDSTKLNKYSINKIYILSDFRQGDNVSNIKNFNLIKTRNFNHLFHHYQYKTSLLERNLTLHTGEIFRQNDFYNSLNNLTKLGVWQNVNIRLVENLDEQNKLDVIVELTPSKKLTTAAIIDLNYSSAGANNNGIAGNLFGTSLNFSVENKNFAKEAIKMTHNFRFGIEFGNKSIANNNNPIQSNEVGYTNDVNIPRLFYPGKSFDPKFHFYYFKSLLKGDKKPFEIANKKYKADKVETFINTNFSYSNRINFFNLQNTALAFGYRSKNARNNFFTFKLLNVEFSKLYNESKAFKDTLNNNPFLKYSYNTSFAIGMSASYSSNYTFPAKKKNNNIRELAFKISGEESGLTWGVLPILSGIKKEYIKIEPEVKYSITSIKKNSLNTRLFLGIGIPLNKTNDALPFFKQFAVGGSSSMRGWPIRGMGRGGQPLKPFSNGASFNDRTGDIQVEFNIEHRHHIKTLLRDLIYLKGAAFFDVGNIWNFKESYDITGVSQNTQFKFRNLYNQIGASAGYGLRFDFTYLVLRTDFGFRIKRPETSNIDNGWKTPDVGFNDIFQKMFYGKYKQWRYENFNFSIGINYPF